MQETRHIHLNGVGGGGRGGVMPVVKEAMHIGILLSEDSQGTYYMEKAR